MKVGLIMNSSQNWEIWLWFLTWAKNCIFIEVHFVNRVSAQKLRCPSSAQLGLEPFQLNSAQLRRFRLEFITAEESILFELYSFCLLTKKCYNHIFFHWSQSMRELIFKKIELRRFFRIWRIYSQFLSPRPIKDGDVIYGRPLLEQPHPTHKTCFMIWQSDISISICIDLWKDGCQMDGTYFFLSESYGHNGLKWFLESACK